MRNRKNITKVIKNDRCFFYGTFDRYIITNGIRGVAQQIVFKNIEDEYGNFISNYAQFDNIDAFINLNLHEGDVVYFRARMVTCQRTEDTVLGSYNPYSGVYIRLMNPTKAKRLIKVIQPAHVIEPIEPVEKLPYRVHITPRK